MKILIEHVATLEKDRLYIGIDEQKIVYVGETKPDAFSDAYTIDGTGRLAFPGLVNAHTHSAMTLMRHYADDCSLFDWLEGSIFPVEAKMRPQDIYWGSKLAACEMIRTGTTCFADMYFMSEQTARVVEESGMRANLNLCIASQETEVSNLAALQNAEHFFHEFHGQADGRITVSIAPHAIYTCSEEVLRACGEMAKKLGCRIHIHVAETKKEFEDCQKAHGCSPVSYLHQLGVFDVPALAAHSVFLTDEDRKIYREQGVALVHNPTSNLKLASGIADIRSALAEGICVLLGTDGAASNNNLNVWEEAHLAALLNKGLFRDPCAVTATDVLRMMGEQGFCALGYSQVGKIEVGYEADLILLNLDTEHATPIHHKEAALVYATQGSDVDTVLCQGKILMEKRELKTLDFEKIRYEVQRSCDFLF